MEALGVPATVVITTPFQGLAASFAASRGAPGYPVVAVPHPLASKSSEELRRIAADMADRVQSRLI
ncbi:MAG: hypothetical protein H0V12_00970 [Chloroflexi bacterium]|nr:hypothetical protein [Chloroflexota bacterium]